MLVAALCERRDAAGERASVSGEIHHGPWAPAHGPGRTVLRSLQAEARFGNCARCAESETERARERSCLVQIVRFIPGHPLIERLIRTCMTDRVILEEDQALQVDLLDADLGGDPHEVRQFGDGLLQASQPGGYAGALAA